MTTKKTRIKHSPEFKAEALKLADKVGVAATARQLSLHESQIYGWRKNSKKDTNTSQREQELAAEVAKLKRQLAEQAEELEIVKKAATYFAKSLIQKSKKLSTTAKAEMAQGVSKKNCLRAVITTMLKPLLPV